MSENEEIQNEALRAIAPKVTTFLEMLAATNAAGVDAIEEISEISERLGGEVGLGLAATGTGVQASNAIVSNLHSQLARFGAMWVLEARAMSIEAEKTTKPDIIIPGRA